MGWPPVDRDRLTIDRYVNNSDIFDFGPEMYQYICTICDHLFYNPEKKKLTRHLCSTEHINLAPVVPRNGYSRRETYYRDLYIKEFEYIEDCGAHLKCVLCPQNNLLPLDHQRIAHHFQSEYHQESVKALKQLVEPDYTCPIDNQNICTSNKCKFVSSVVKQFPGVYYMTDDEESDLFCIYCRLILKPTNFYDYSAIARNHQKCPLHLQKVNKRIDGLYVEVCVPEGRSPSVIKNPEIPLATRTIRDIKQLLDATQMVLERKITFNSTNNNNNNKDLVIQVAGRWISPSTMLQRGIPLLHEDSVENMRRYIQNKKIGIIIDETTKKKGKFVGFMVVTLDEDMRIFKFRLMKLEKDPNRKNQTISMDAPRTVDFVQTTLAQIWPEGIPKQQILALITDGANYNLTAGRTLKREFPDLLHILCNVHGLHLIAEQIRKLHSLVHKFVTLFQQVINRAELRKEDLCEVISKYFLVVHQPRDFTTIRWTTWLTAVSYHFHYFDAVVEYVSNLSCPRGAQEKDQSRIAKLKNLVRLNRDNLYADLKFIHENYSELNIFLRKLSVQNLKLNESYELFQNAMSYIYAAMERFEERGPEDTQYLKTINISLKMFAVYTKNKDLDLAIETIID